MKTWILMLVAAVLGMAFAANCAQPPANDNNVPKYDKATEVKLSGTVEDVRDYHCPVSGTLGSHITLKMASGASWSSNSEIETWVCWKDCRKNCAIFPCHSGCIIHLSIRS